MSQALIQSADCCSPCPDIPITQIPGPAGEDGQDGTNGTDGINAFTITTAGFTMPAVSGTVDVDVAEASWASAGQVIYVTGAGYFEVDAVLSATSLRLLNQGYPGNVAPATIVAISQTVSPAGLKGVDGTSPPASTLNDLSPTTTKGDALVDNGANNPNASVVRLAAGADGTVFATDSAQPTGRKQVAITPNAATDNVLPRFDASGDTTPTPLQATLILVTDDGAVQSTPTGGNARGSKAVDLQVERANATEVASGARSIISGGANNTASGADSVAVGFGNTASGANSTALGSGNSATGSGSLSEGLQNLSNGNSSVCGGGNLNTATADFSTASGGFANEAEADYSSIGGGRANNSSGATIADYSSIPGGWAALTELYGQMAHASGSITQAGDAQTSEIIFRITTSDATANVEMFLDGSAARAVMWGFSSWAFHIITVARNTANGLSAVWETKGGVKRSGGPISLIGLISHAMLCDDGEGWMVAGAVVVDADAANVSLRIRVTGAIATNIEWVAHARLVQVHY